MANYADHPGADRIYRLARKKSPKRASPPRRYQPRQWRNAPSPLLHPDIRADYERTNRSRLKKIEGRVRYLSRKDRAIDALKEIDKHKRNRVITARQHDRMRSWISASLYYQGYVDTAKKIANSVAKRNGDTAVLSYWTSGLIAFRNGNVENAYRHFENMSEVSYQEDALRAAAGFWAARTALAAGYPENIRPQLEIAATYPFTFYGQLALAQLGQDFSYDWQQPYIAPTQAIEFSKTNPRIARAIALTQIGRLADAELEMRWANGEIEQDAEYTLLAIASGLNLPAAQLEIALSSDEPYRYASLYPIPEYTPGDGFTTDRALLYGLIRQESKFKTDATSRVGARGLMQLMPRTASYISKDKSLRSKKGRNKLYNPSFNLALGQDYVEYLIANAADGNLFHMAAAYNGGPGNLGKWRREVNIEDPLLFIESIPNTESRNFVEKVLTNVWVYRARLGQDAPSRNKVAAGELPLYEALDQLTAQ